MGRPIKKDATDQSTVIRIIDSTTGLPETAVEHDTSGIALWYRREGAAVTAITEAALAALDSAHSDGGIEHIGDGYYRLDMPDAACATGANSVQFGGTVTGMVVIGNEHFLTTNLIDDVKTETASILGDTNELQTDLVNGGRLDLLIDSIISSLSLVPQSGGTTSWNASALAAIGDAIADEAFEGTVTLRQAVKLFLSVLTGESSGGGTTTLTFRDIGDTKNRLVVTVDADGNRTSVGTRDGS